MILVTPWYSEEKTTKENAAAQRQKIQKFQRE